jgi:hypothetical protein
MIFAVRHINLFPADVILVRLLYSHCYLPILHTFKHQEIYLFPLHVIVNIQHEYSHHYWIRSKKSIEI